MAQAWEAMRQVDAELERRGMEVLEQVEADDRIALVLLCRPYHLDQGLNHGLLEEFQALGYPVISIRSIPKDKAWLSRWFGSEADTGMSPLDIRDVWPENYSTNSVQKVWAAKFAARHPNVAVLDLSSFKCGHDSPTYGLIDTIIKAGKTPYMALHDIDANKPSGSMKIRVKTFGHTLKRVEEELQDRAARMDELERRITERRRELMHQYRAQQLEEALADPRKRQALEEMDAAFETYLAEDEHILGIRLSETSHEGQHLISLRDDIRPSEPEITVLDLSGRRLAAAENR